MYMVRNLEIRNCKLCLFYLSLFILIKLSIFEFPLHYSYTNKFKSTIFHHFFRFFFFFFLQTTTKRQTVYTYMFSIYLFLVARKALNIPINVAISHLIQPRTIMSYDPRETCSSRFASLTNN